MKIEKIDHIAINVRNLEEATKFFSDLLDTEFSGPLIIEEMNSRSVLDPLGIELIESMTPDGIVAQTIERRGEGLSLVSLKVPNLEEAIAEMERRGIRLVARIGSGTMKAAMFHPKDTYGVMIELIEYKEVHPVIASSRG